jgi:hypothetical protein
MVHPGGVGGAQETGNGHLLLPDATAAGHMTAEDATEPSPHLPGSFGACDSKDEKGRGEVWM